MIEQSGPAFHNRGRGPAPAFVVSLGQITEVASTAWAQVQLEATEVVGGP